jgi:hypothetical protein
MQKQANGQFTRRLHDLRRPIELYAQAGPARTAPFTIVPEPADPSPEDPKGEPQATDGTADPSPGSATQPAATQANQARPLPAGELARRLDELTRSLKQLAARAEALAQAVKASGNPEASADRAALNRRADRLSQRLDALAGRLDKALPRAANAALLKRTRRALAQTGLTGASEQGSGTANDSPAGGASKLEARARQAARTLGELRDRWRASASGRPSRAGNAAGQPATPRAGTDPDPGQTSETIAPGQRGNLPGQYDWQQVPEQYRPIVEAYYRELNKPTEPEE